MEYLRVGFSFYTKSGPHKKNSFLNAYSGFLAAMPPDVRKGTVLSYSSCNCSL
jgi:hypothetical protein